MDAPAMLTNKHVPEDVGLRNIAAAEEEGGQGQMHRGEEKQHKPVLKKVKEKVKKIKNTIAGGGHGGNNGDGERAGGSSNSSSSSEEDEHDVAAQRMGDVDQRGYQEDVEEDKPVAMESDPEVHGAPMYDSARIPAVQEVEGDGGAPRVRLGDLGGPVVEDPAAPHSTTRVPREGEDIGTTPVVRAFESMSVSDDPKHVGAGKPDVDVPNDPMPVSDAATAGEEWKDATPDGAAAGATPENAASGATYTDKIKSAAAGTTEYGKKLATTVYEKVAGVGTVVAGKVQQVTQSTGTATPGVGAGSQSQSQDADADADASTTLASGEPATGGQQDKGVTVTGYIADKLRPGDEDRALSEAISGAVQRRKEDVAQRVPAAPAPGDTMAKVREAPAQVLAKARDAVTSLTGGSRVSDTVQPTTATDASVMEDGAEVEAAPVIRGEEIGETQRQPNVSMT
uniref:Uncharacterized protein n=1 Tax=Oryza punctata TaxID=4537 RepID=A0A0E0M9G6_ORYPU